MKNIKQNRKITGNMGESAVCSFLERNGYEILRRNYCIKGGEIDIIAENKQYIAFVEVKTRNKNCIVSGIETVNMKKQCRIIQTAIDYYSKNITELQMRFDIAEVIITGNKIVKLNYIPNAFDMSDFDNIFI